MLSLLNFDIFLLPHEFPFSLFVFLCLLWCFLLGTKESHYIMMFVLEKMQYIQHSGITMQLHLNGAHFQKHTKWWTRLTEWQAQSRIVMTQHCLVSLRSQTSKSPWDLGVLLLYRLWVKNSKLIVTRQANRSTAMLLSKCYSIESANNSEGAGQLSLIRFDICLSPKWYTLGKKRNATATATGSIFVSQYMNVVINQNN